MKKARRIDMDTKKLRQKILDLAIRGRLVPQDPNDEPASVLLERIRAEKERLIKEGKIKRSKKSASDTPHYENEMPFEVPESWEWTNLGEISNYGNCENVDVNDIPSNGWVLELEDLEKDSAKVIQRLTKDERDIKGVRHSFHKGDVLYSKLRTYLNKVTVALEDGFCTTEIIPVTCMSFILPEYLNHVLRSKYFVDYTIQCGYGVKMPRLSTTDACNGLIPLPPYNEQKHIVASIESWFQIIDILESDKLNLDEAIQKAKSKILDLAIHGKLVPQDPSDEPAIELLKRINPKFTPCDNAHDTNQLPDSWCWSTLGDVCSFISGYSYSSSEYKKAGIPLVRISDINDGIISLDNCAYIQPQGERNVYLQKGDILIAMSGATTGKMGIYMDEESAILNQRVGVVRVTNSKIISEKYRDYFLYRKSSDILKLAYGGAQPNISGKMICSLLLPLPPYSEQLRIVAKTEELFTILDEIQKSIEA